MKGFRTTYSIMVFITKSYVSVQYLSTSQSIFKDQLKNAKKFNLSSQNWLQRQLNDPWVKKSKIENYRCRSAFKLLEINEKFKLLRPGQAVVDLGCAPGSWTQVAVRATKSSLPGSGSVVVGVDLSPVHPINGATLLSRLDMTTETAQQSLKEALGARGVDVVLSDMAPSASGIRSMDHENIVRLCDNALKFACKTSCTGGALVMKMLEGGDTKRVVADCKTHYKTVRHVRPEASRKDSSELFIVCLNFKGNTSQVDSESLNETSKDKTVLQ